MFRWSRFREPLAARRLLSLLLGALLLGFSLASQAEDRTLLLEVSINGVSLQRIGEFEMRNDILETTAEEWRSLGFSVPAEIEDAARVAADTLPEVIPRIDELKQAVDFAVPPARLRERVINASEQSGLRQYESGTGLVANYTLVGTHTAEDMNISGALEFRAFSPYGVASHSMLFTNSDLSRRSIRLDTSYVISQTEAMNRIRLGDFVGQGPQWSRAVRLGGVQWTTDFSLRPDLVTFPVARLEGLVAVPSTVDLLVNGVRQMSQTVGPGPFEIRQPPMVTGRGDISLVVRDALGRETVQTLSYYASERLLTEGLTSSTYELGWIRRNYGLRSNDYAGLAGTASWRRGLRDWLTVGVHGEATNDVNVVGGDAVIGLGSFGLLGVTLAGSRGKGALYGYSYERMDSGFSFGFSQQRRVSEYIDLAGKLGESMPKMQTRAFAGYSLGRYGHLGMAYTAQRSASMPTPWSEERRPTYSTRILSASYTVSLSRSASLFVTAFKDFEDSSTRGVSVGLSLALDRGTSATLSQNRDGDLNTFSAMLHRPAYAIGDWGVRLQGDGGDYPRQQAEVEYRARWVRSRFGMERFRGETVSRGQLEGSIAYLDGGLFASESIEDSFAVVETPGLADVGVYYENRPIGRTGLDGKLLVPDLRAYERNAISIDVLDVPFHLGLDSDRKDVYPADRSGIAVRFEVVYRRAAEIVIALPSGEAVPLGSTATYLDGEPTPVGHDGRVYLRGLADFGQLQVTLPDLSTCVAEYDFAGTVDQLPTLGPVPCE